MRPITTLIDGAASLLLGATILVSAPVAAAGAEDTALSPVAGTPMAPDFELQGPKGRDYRLSELLGQPLIVNFWATWCPPCRAEMPAMQRAWEQVRDEGIGVIAINVGEDAGTIETFLEQVPVSFPVPMDTDSSVTQSWPLKGLPTTFVLAPDGRLIYQAAGERAWDDPALLDRVRALRGPETQGQPAS
jgi:thiol-disulfide isomerase/thioredoxin